MAPNVSAAGTGISLRAVIARNILEDYVKKELSKERLHAPTPGPDWQTEQLPDFSIGLPPKDPPAPPVGKVCIIGAGMAGLSLANGLKAIHKYDFDILEASSDRVGGRVYTQNFSDLDIKHNYYDVGAMRIPDIPAMASTLALITALGLDSKKVPYTYIAGSEPGMYNFSSDPPADLNKAYQAFEALVNPIASPTIGEITSAKGDDAWDILMGWDLNSTRQWLQQLPVNTKTGKLPTGTPMLWSDTVKAETMDTSTGLFDQAFTETICDYQDFAQAQGKSWYRMEGGMQVIPNTLASLIETKSGDYPGVPIQLGKRVTALAYDKQSQQFQVTLDDGTTKTYAYLFNTTPMACLYQMDISGLGLTEDFYNAIRTLAYDRSCKVAIAFNNPWWNKYPATANGGTSSTDLPIRTVVYPNWNDGANNPAVLIASYTWAQDASRMGAFISNSSTPIKNLSDPLIQLVLSNIAKLWSNVPEGPSFQDLQNWYVEHHAWAWSHDLETPGGAFALFGPGQFSQVYPLFQKGQCDNNFWVCGEATSAHHAWISGAIDSAGTTLLNWLAVHQNSEAMAVLKASPWGGAAGKVPDEVDEKVLWAKAQLGESHK